MSEKDLQIAALKKQRDDLKDDIFKMEKRQKKTELGPFMQSQLASYMETLEEVRDKITSLGPLELWDGLLKSRAANFAVKKKEEKVRVLLSKVVAEASEAEKKSMEAEQHVRELRQEQLQDEDTSLAVREKILAQLADPV